MPPVVFIVPPDPVPPVARSAEDVPPVAELNEAKLDVPEKLPTVTVYEVEGVTVETSIENPPPPPPFSPPPPQTLARTDVTPLGAVQLALDVKNWTLPEPKTPVMGLLFPAEKVAILLIRKFSK
jgi:hypothetical protein